MSTLTGKKFKNYYKSLLHLEDELPLTSTKKVVQDGDGNAMPFKVSSLGVEFTGTVEGVTKTHVGLANLDNTSDVNKPVSTLQQAALDLKLNIGAVAGGDLSGTYPNPAILNSAVLAKLLTGLNISGGSIASTDNLLQAFGKLQSQLNAVLGGAIYQSVWNASTNSPSLASGAGTKGYYYVVSVAGSTNLNGVTDWKVGDWAIYNGSAWEKVDNTDAVSSVNGFTGAVSLTSANITEVTNLYFTNARAIAAVLTGYTSGAGTVSASDTVLQAIQKLNGNIAAIVSLTAANLASVGHAASAKGTLVDADEITGQDSASSWSLIRVTALNIWNYIKSKADTVYQAVLVSGTNIKTINGSSILGSGDLTVSGGTGGAYILKTANYTLTDTEAEGIVDCTGTHTQTLPTAVGRSGKKFTIKNSGTGIITVNTTSSQTIDGATSVRINTQYNTRTFQSDGANWVIVGIAFTNLQIFTASGTWSKPAGAKFVQVIALGGGGGGASGRRGAASSLRCGGGGGGSGMLVNLTLLASIFGDTETVTIGAGGIGAAAITANDTNGTIGGNAGDTLVGSLVKAFRGFSGAGGTAATSANGGGGQGILNPQMQILGQNGGNGSTSGTGGTGGNQDVYLGPSAGGGGGGIDASNNVRNGGVGGRIQQNGATGALNCPIANFTNVAAAAVSTDGGVSIALPNYGGMTIGGGGGGGNGNGNNGGNAGGPGAGGGGGGASLNGTNSGAGGNGGDGWCVMITYF
jgi:hypothetical protein